MNRREVIEHLEDWYSLTIMANETGDGMDARKLSSEADGHLSKVLDAFDSLNSRLEELEAAKNRRN